MLAALRVSAAHEAEARLVPVQAAHSLLRGRPPPAMRSRPATLADAGRGVGKAAFGAELIELEPGSATYLVGATIKRDRYKTLQDNWTVDDSLDELQRLCETAGLDVRGRTSQTMQTPSASTYLGQGKLEEVAEAVKRLGVETVIFDEELTPGQGRNIQKVLGEGRRRGVGPTEGAQVVDRTQLILHIFAQRARTKEAKLQVRAAQMSYMLPRLSTFLTEGAGLDAKGGSRGGAGGYLKGAGESQLEVDRRLYRQQLSKIQKSIEEVRAKRSAYRAKRQEQDRLPTVALVGYTNAGKSTLLNALCGTKEVYADDLLFATLDPTTRRVDLPGGKEVMVSDTVGFIQKLPTKLVASFRATLDEVEDAAVVLHVVDAASPLALRQVQSVQHVLADLGALDKPQLLVLNKADALAADPEVQKTAFETDWIALYPGAAPALVAISAKDGRGMAKLLTALEDALLALQVPIDCVLPYSEAALVAEVKRSGTVEREEYTAAGTAIAARVPVSVRNRIEKACQAASTHFESA